MRAFVANKRGRPRRQDAANDNARNVADLGTAEQQLKRSAIARGAKVEAANHPLDLLLAHSLIDASEQRAGWQYAVLYRRVVGRTEVSYGRLYAGLAGESRGRPGAADVDSAARDAELADAQTLFRAAQQRLRAEGAVVAGITERLAVFGVFPDWLLAQDATARRERGLLRKGLRQLADVFRLNKERCA